jgi:hypothetical protein
MKMIAPLGAILDAMRPALVDLAKNSNIATANCNGTVLSAK